jgi:predicted transcriptional regulator
MVNKILLPQEIETYYIIPTIRRYYAKHLKELGMKQKDIAEILQISTSAISQYTSTKRGHAISFPKEVEDEIIESVKKLKNSFTYIQETQRILTFIRNTQHLCHFHRLFCSLPEDCRPSTAGCHSEETK